MVLGCQRCGEVICDQIGPHKKRVDPGKVATNELVSELRAERLECPETGAEILASIPGSIRVVVNFPIDVWRNRGIVFDHYNTGSELFHAFPNVIGVLIDIQRQQIEFLRDLELF